MSGVSSLDPVSTTTTSSTMPARDSRHPPRNFASSRAMRTADNRGGRSGLLLPVAGVLDDLGLVLPVLVRRRARLPRLVLPVLVRRRHLMGLVLPVLVGRRPQRLA